MFWTRRNLLSMGGLVLLLSLACGGAGTSQTVSTDGGGTLDSTFGSSGMVTTSIGGTNDAA
ncbi:hypothetical protein [Holophaga foetida]|uniref:hypothetical protein n=1 Tax=Holophaga foetida TaxID=35839 RepID=UPI0002471CDB|nr:hypothetical protein [Holophaga foetida]